MLPPARVKEFGRPADEVTGGTARLSATLTVREAVRPAACAPAARRVSAAGREVVGRCCEISSELLQLWGPSARRVPRGRKNTRSERLHHCTKFSMRGFSA